MKNFKRVFALALVLVMAITVAACHPKDEVAVKVGDIEFTSAYYMCALINADSEAKSKVEEELSEDESADDIDYYSKKIDDKDFVTWVEDTALDYLKEIAAYKTLCKENELEISEEDAANAENNASYYWSSYGYSAYFEPNGVGEATYTQYMKDTYYSSLYFDFLYGEGGEKEIAADTVKTKMYENYLIANILEVSFSNSEDDEITALKEKINGYAADLKSGKKTFGEVYKDYNGITDDTEEETESEEPHPKDEYATVLGSEDTYYASEQYETLKAMATGEVKVIELDDDAGLVLAVKQDIAADSYYLDVLDISTRHLIADEEYEKDMKEYASKMDCDVNNYAVKQFKVKKIIEPSYN
ncbi:MAG: hypothetical protein UHO61_06305 [Acutalibacteraceae bacterium]|nr:hypothetical protein [Acutalibacteraceae bacterium]